MKGFPVSLTIPVLWGDMDALRHVNNTRYFTWFEAVRIAYFDRLRGAHAPPAAADDGASAGQARRISQAPVDDGASAAPARLRTGEVGPILASTKCDYLRPVVYPGTVEVGARVAEVGNSSMRMDYLVVRTDAPDEPCARGTSVVVLVRYATLEKVRVSDEMRAAITTLEDGAADP
jgi:acyl-CoA thioester hydrolase